MAASCLSPAMPDSGKSRLIAEFCNSQAYSRWKIGYGACLEFASRPYGPVLEVLSRIEGAPFDLSAAGTKREQFDAIADRMAQIASRTAAIAVLEDLHWADAATLELLGYLATKLHRMRVLVIASVRGDELHADHPATAGIAKIARYACATRIELGPLRGVELQTFINEALGGIALPDETRRAIALAADGNPFFTEELLKNAVERNSPQDRYRRRGDLPQTIRATLLERLRPFDEAERRVVAQAAVIGRSFGLELLAATLETEPRTLLPTLRRARDLQLVEEVTPELFRFRHGLTRDVIYGEFLGAELQPRHRTIALALESAPLERRSLEALAYHWWAAKDASHAIRYNELAGDAAAGIHAHERDRVLRASARVRRRIGAAWIHHEESRRPAAGFGVDEGGAGELLGCGRYPSRRGRSRKRSGVPRDRRDHRIRHRIT